MFFKGVPLYSGLGEADHALLLQAALRRRYPRHTILVREGDAGERLYCVKVYLDNTDGREVILSILGHNDFLGEMALIDDEPCSACVMTLEENEFVSISRGEFQR